MAQSEHSSAVGYQVTIGARTFEQTEADGVQLLVVEDHVDMVDMLVMRIGGAEGLPECNFKIGDPVECSLGKAETPIF